MLSSSNRNSTFILTFTTNLILYFEYRIIKELNLTLSNLTDQINLIS
jgi:hypothetical protein